MNKKNLFWILGIGLALLLVCAASVGFGLLFADSLSTGNMSFGDAVALIRVDGIIVAGEPPQDLFGNSAGGAYSNLIVRRLKMADEDPQVKAVVLRVESPGGGVVASDEIYEQMTAMTKPTLISMGTLAASGGYYISAPATEIWANRHTLTGSLGVIIQFPNIEGFMEEYGIDVETVKSGGNKDSGSFFRDLTTEERQIWQEIIDEAYDVFVQIIAEGRQLDEATVRELADGRVYTGQQALELGLIDNLGNLQDVIDRAAELGGIDGEPRIIDYRRPTSGLSGLLGALRRPGPVEELQQLLHLNTGPTPMYLYTGE